MPIYTPQTFRDANGWPNHKPTNHQIEDALAVASQQLRNWVGNTTVENVITWLTNPTSTTPQQLQQAHSLRRALRHLTLHYLLPEINLYVSDHGIFLSAKGDSDFGGSSIRVANPNEINHMKKAHHSDALSAAKPWIATTTVTPHIPTTGT